MNPNLLALFFTHMAVADATSYSPWIDQLLYDYFRKGDRTHLVLKVNNDDAIDARVLLGALSRLIETAERQLASLDGQTHQFAISTRLNLESPGMIELITENAKGMFIIGAIIVGLNGGQLSLSFENLDVDIETTGLIDSVSSFLNDEKDREIKDALTSKINQLQISNPEQVAEILRQIEAQDSDDE